MKQTLPQDFQPTKFFMVAFFRFPGVSPCLAMSQGSGRPSTYEDALVLLGGSEEVQKFAEQSEDAEQTPLQLSCFF